MHRRCRSTGWTPFLESSVLLLVLLAGRSLAVPPGAPKWSVGPVPSWVQELEWDARPEGRKAEPGEKMTYLLMDQQMRVRGGHVERYYRRTKRILSTSGVQDESELKFNFAPSFETLAIHYIRIVRDGRPADALVPSEVKVIQQESGLEEQIYDESLSALVFLKDVRAGDVIDFAYSVVGENPVLAGRFASRMFLGSGHRVGRIRQRLLWESTAPVYLKAHGTDAQPLVASNGVGKVYTWERRDVPPAAFEDDTPSWFEPIPWIQATDFATWNDVARWATDLFRVDARDLPGLSSLAATWTGDPTQRALAAIRFVQDDVRYLGMEIGPNSHRPHPPGQVLAQRFGDCKDKALLLTALLRIVGVEADAALVNTRARQTLDAWHPSPFAFDHVIVRIHHGGRIVWVDATHAHQGGDLSGLATPRFRRALVVRADSQALLPIDVSMPARETRVVEETYTVTKNAAAFASKTSYTGDEADRMRAELARATPEELGKRYLNFYAHEDPGLKSTAPLRVRDDRRANTIVVEESYAIPDFWKSKSRRFFAGTVGEMIVLPDTRLRSTPLRVRHPVYVREVVHVQLPDRIDARSRLEHHRSAGFELDTKTETSGKQITLEYRYRSLQDSIPVADVENYLKVAKGAREDLYYWVDPPSGAASVASVASSVDGRALAIAAGVLAIVGGAFGLRAARRAVRRRRFLRDRSFQPGEAPSAAIRVRSDSELAEKVRAAKCRCGARIDSADSRRETIVFNERAMTVVSRNCASCRAEQTLYFDVGTPATS